MSGRTALHMKTRASRKSDSWQWRRTVQRYPAIWCRAALDRELGKELSLTLGNESTPFSTTHAVDISTFGIRFSVTLLFQFYVSDCKSRISRFPFPVPHLRFPIPNLPILISPISFHVSDFVFQSSTFGIQPSGILDFQIRVSSFEVEITTLLPIPVHSDFLFQLSCFWLLI